MLGVHLEVVWLPHVLLRRAAPGLVAGEARPGARLLLARVAGHGRAGAGRVAGARVLRGVGVRVGHRAGGRAGTGYRGAESSKWRLLHLRRTVIIQS